MANAKQQNDIDVRVGEKIRIRRRLLGMSQSKLGRSIGVTFQQIQKYERGTNRIGASRLLTISNILQVDPSHFFDDENGSASPGAQGDTNEAEALAMFIASKDGLEINRAFAAISSATIRRSIVALAVALARSSDGDDVGDDRARQN